MTKFNSLFLLAVTLLASFISLRGILTAAGLPARVFQILFAPVTLYLIFRLIRPATPQSGKSPLVIYCFIVSAVLVTIDFTSARTTSQLISSLVFLPLVAYFFILVWPRPNLAPAESPVTKLDTDRRNFLKLLGSAGLIALLSGLFAKRADFLFPPPTPPAPDSTESAAISPTAGYLVTEIDESETAHFGFTNKIGQWFIMKQNPDNSYRYARGDHEFSANWTNRSSLKYGYFEEIF